VVGIKNRQGSWLARVLLAHLLDRGGVWSVKRSPFIITSEGEEAEFPSEFEASILASVFEARQRCVCVFQLVG
jgi:hypothetical protein